jgi:hypothetical protein
MICGSIASKAAGTCGVLAASVTACARVRWLGWFDGCTSSGVAVKRSSLFAIFLASRGSSGRSKAARLFAAAGNEPFALTAVVETRCACCTAFDLADSASKPARPGVGTALASSFIATGVEACVAPFAAGSGVAFSFGETVPKT